MVMACLISASFLNLFQGRQKGELPRLYFDILFRQCYAAIFIIWLWGLLHFHPGAISNIHPC
jgi:hypothetical protein